MPSSRLPCAIPPTFIFIQFLTLTSQPLLPPSRLPCTDYRSSASASAARVYLFVAGTCLLCGVSLCSLSSLWLEFIFNVAQVRVFSVTRAFLLYGWVCLLFSGRFMFVAPHIVAAAIKSLPTLEPCLAACMC